MALIRIAKKHGIKFGILFLAIAGIGYIFADPPKYVGYSPDQPIPFSHKIHAGELQIDCQFCHSGVEKSAHATVPDSATCMKCHEYVAGDSKHIQYLRSSYKKGIPLRWNKVYDLPDHARFNHKAHIARGLDCTNCHGDVKNMTKIEVAAEFNMGWCVNCHRTYTEKLKLQADKPGNNVSVHLTDCSTCHY